jgi:glycosyltransferase involved in cell wall biosynthesis
MRVCLDYQPAVAQRAGIGRYTRELARHAGRLKGPGDELRLFYFDFRGRGEPPDVPGAKAQAWRRLPGACVQQAWKRWNWPDFGILAGPADVYHFTNFVIPPLRRGRAIATIFDMSFERWPQFAEAANLRYLRARLAATVDRADAILTISRFSADEIRAFYPAAAGKTHAIPLGIDAAFGPSPAADVTAMRERLGLVRPFLLSVGTVEPRKNFPFLFDLLDALAGRDLDLVIAGAPGWQCEPIFERMRGARAAARIRYLRYVTDAELRALYTGASIFLLASFYEGFGFPPLEAMACGTPVISAATGSLPEVLGDAAMLLPDFDVDAWRAAVGRLLDDAREREALAGRGRIRAAMYRWDETAARTWRVYRELTGRTA